MSYGTWRTFKSKKALREAVEAGEDPGVFGTSVFGNEQAERCSELADTSAVIVGPNVYNDRRWYATIARKRDGSLTVK